MDVELQVLKHLARAPQPTALVIDSYCQSYQDLFKEVRNYECFKYLHLGLVSPIKRKSLPEIGLGIGRSRGTYVGWEREWLFWYDQEGNAYRTLEELAEQQRQRAEQYQQRVERAERAEKTLQEQQQQIATKVFSLGLDLTIEQITTACNLSPTELRAILEQP